MSEQAIADELRFTSRAMLAGAMIGCVASINRQRQASQDGINTTNENVKKVAADTLRAGAISAATTYTANKMVEKPVLSLATILAVGMAGACLLSTKTSANQKGNRYEQG